MSHAGASSSPFFLNPYLFSLANPWAQTCYGIKIVPPRSAPLVLLLRLTVAGCVLDEVLGRAHGFFWYSSNFVFFLTVIIRELAKTAWRGGASMCLLLNKKLLPSSFDAGVVFCDRKASSPSNILSGIAESRASTETTACICGRNWLEGEGRTSHPELGDRSF